MRKLCTIVECALITDHTKYALSTDSTVCKCLTKTLVPVLGQMPGGVYYLSTEYYLFTIPISLKRLAVKSSGWDDDAPSGTVPAAACGGVEPTTFWLDSSALMGEFLGFPLAA